MGEPKKDVDRKPPGRGQLGKWIGTQATNLEPTRRAAAVHIMSRWNVADPWFSFARTVRTLRREDSEFLIGALALADDYAQAFQADALAELGSVGPFVPYDIVTCEKCKREAVPGSTLCGRHGGQYLSASDAEQISAHTSARIMNATDKAFRVLEELLDEGRSEMVRLQAATALLDRAGIGPTSKVEIDLGTAGTDAANYLRERLAEAAKSMAKVEQIEAHRVDEMTPVDVEAELEPDPEKQPE